MVKENIGKKNLINISESDLTNLSKSSRIFKIAKEKLGLERTNSYQIKKLSDFLNIELNAEINRATYAGKVWTGDKLSQFNSPDGKYIEKVADNQWQSFFSKKDKLILNLIYKDYSSFGYKMERINWIKIVLIF